MPELKEIKFIQYKNCLNKRIHFLCQHGPSCCFTTLSSVQTRQCLLHDYYMLCCILWGLPSRIFLIYFSLLHLWFWHFLLASPLPQQEWRQDIYPNVYHVYHLSYIFSKGDLYLGKLRFQVCFFLIDFFNKYSLRTLYDTD